MFESFIKIHTHTTDKTYEIAHTSRFADLKAATQIFAQTLSACGGGGRRELSIILILIATTATVVTRICVYMIICAPVNNKYSR